MTIPRAGIELKVLPERHDRGRVHRSASLTLPGDEVIEIWYAIDEYARDALVDSADPFVVAALPLAMRRGLDLRVLGAPVSPSLLDTLERFQEVWHDWSRAAMVDVTAEEERERDVPAHGRSLRVLRWRRLRVHRVPAHPAASRSAIVTCALR